MAKLYTFFCKILFSPYNLLKKNGCIHIMLDPTCMYTFLFFLYFAKVCIIPHKHYFLITINKLKWFAMRYMVLLLGDLRRHSATHSCKLLCIWCRWTVMSRWQLFTSTCIYIAACYITVKFAILCS